MITFRSHGKLLLTAEYLVLDGAKALALPTKFGQSLTVEPIKDPKLDWRSIDHNGNIWFKSEFSLKKTNSSQTPHNDLEKRVLQILNATKQLNPNFLSDETGFRITTKLDFPNQWGLGSSSTLINNIAHWANVDAYKLLNLTFGGSGYDIACAQNSTPITYQNKTPNKTRVINSIVFNPSFKNELFFVHLNKKQNSREGIKHYKKNTQSVLSAVNEIDALTESMIHCSSIFEFQNLISIHERIISQLINLPTVKSVLFSDYSGAIKSLGAWGGDFILVTGSHNEMSYFKKKGYPTIIPYSDMIL
jgi:mevalonate kinase